MSTREWTGEASPTHVFVKAAEVPPDRPRSTIAAAPGTRPRHLLTALLALSAAALWVDAVRHIDPRTIGDLGLLSALPPAAFVALGFIAVSFALTLGDERVHTPLALLHVFVLVLMLHGATSMLGSEPAFNVVWRHAGVTDYVLTTGGIDPDIDAYFNWPGFFFLSALATHAAGLDSTLPLSGWAPVAFQLLYLPPVVVISRTFTADPRLSWTAVWIFYATNWVGQDYFSPQAMGLLMYLSLIAVVLSGLSRRSAPELGLLRERGTRLLVRVGARRPGVLLEEVVPPAVSRTQRAALVPLCVVIIAATVASHQLTPWLMLASLTALVALRRCTARGLPVITLALVVTWMTYLAAAYLDGHLKPLLTQALEIEQTVTANVGGRLQGSPDHVFVVRVRLAMTALLYALAVAGAVRGLRRGQSHPSHAILALAPAAVAVLQPYGGEMFMRVYLFTLPFLACYAAQALMPPSGWRGARTVAVLAAGSMLLLAGFVVTRWGNERTRLFTTAEVRAVDRLYAIAPKGSTLVAVSPNLPWQHRHYADYRYRLLSRQLEIPPPAPGPARLADEVAQYLRRSQPSRAYLLVTRSQKAYDELLGAQLWGSATQLERAAERSRLFRKVYDNGDGKIFVLSRRGAGSGR